MLQLFPAKEYLMDGPTRPDVLSNPLLTAAVFCLPAVVIVLSGIVDMGNGLRGAVWFASLSVMATGCLVNARRCGRTHCYFTGPFFILMALASLFFGIGSLPLGSSGWNWIGGVTLCGAVILGCVPELLLGKYRRP